MDEIREALNSVRARSPHARVHVVVGSAVQAKALERRLAVQAGAPLGVGHAGVAGVQVLRAVDLADQLIRVLSDDAVRAATMQEAAEDGVRPALAAAFVEPGTWLDLSREHPPSWYRLARALVRASVLCSASEASLPVPQVPIAAEVERLLGERGLVLTGRLLTKAAELVRSAPDDALARAVGSVVWVRPASGASFSGAVGVLYDALAGAGRVTPVVPGSNGAAGAAVSRRVVVLPDAQVEARVAARQVRDWLAAGINYDDIVVVTPTSTGYQALLRAALGDWGIATWSTLPAQVLAATPAGRLVENLARALDSLPGCGACGIVPRHECNGQFAHVAAVLQESLPHGLSAPILDAARTLNLTCGLGNWRQLLRWLAGDAAALPAATLRNANAVDGRGAVRSEPRPPLTADDLAAAARALEEVLAPEVPATAAGLRDRLEALADLALNSGNRRIVGLPPVLEALTTVDQAAPVHLALVRPLLARPWGSSPRAGDGVAIVPVDQLAAVDATHVAWCGLVEGLCPPTASPDPLVEGDLAVVRAAQANLDDEAARVQTGATAFLATAPRVRIGTRAVEVASRWLVQWAGLRDVGAAAVLSEPEARVASWQHDKRWTVEVEDASLDVLARTPTPADVLEPGSANAAAATEAAAAVLAHVADWAGDTPGVQDGVIGAPDDDAHWLARRIASHWALSPSRAQAFEECPRRFYYASVLGLRPLDRDPVLGAESPRNLWGEAVHAALAESFAFVRSATPGERVDLMHAAITRQLAAYLPFLDLADPETAHDIQRQAELIVEVIPPDMWDRDLPAFEEEVTGELAGLPVRGFVDVGWPDLVVDLKTGKRNDERYLVQVGMYAELRSAQTGGTVDSAVWFVKDDRREPPGVLAGPTVTAGQDTEAAPQQELMVALRAAVQRGIFPAVGDPVARTDPCTYCDFTTLCDPGTADRWQRIQDAEVFGLVLTDVDHAQPTDAEGQGE